MVHELWDYQIVIISYFNADHLILIYGTLLINNLLDPFGVDQSRVDILNINRVSKHLWILET